jgi:hypothetical protein
MTSSRKFTAVYGLNRRHFFDHNFLLLVETYLSRIAFFYMAFNGISYEISNDETFLSEI